MVRPSAAKVHYVYPFWFSVYNHLVSLLEQRTSVFLCGTFHLSLALCALSFARTWFNIAGLDSSPISAAFYARLNAALITFV